MVQGEIFEYLQRQTKPITSQEIADGLGVRVLNIRNALTRMIKFKEINRKQKHNLYHYWVDK